MKYVELSLLEDDAAQVALLLANYGAFDPEIIEDAADQLPELPGEAYRQAYTESRAHLDKILAHFEFSAPDAVNAPIAAGQSCRVDGIRVMAGDGVGKMLG
jgi:hypothetical protein